MAASAFPLAIFVPFAILKVTQKNLCSGKVIYFLGDEHTSERVARHIWSVESGCAQLILDHMLVDKGAAGESAFLKYESSKLR
jgi:hypothetical protein